MADTASTDNIDKTPLLKAKKPRPPQSAKQMENFKKMADKRAENVIARKGERLLIAQRALLEKEGYVKKGETQGQQQQQQIQFEIEEEEEEPPKVAIKKIRQPAPPKIKETPKQVVRKTRVPIIQEEDEDEDEGSSSDEEVIIIKRSSKKKKTLRQNKRDEYDDEDDTPPTPPMNYNNFFC